MARRVLLAVDAATTGLTADDAVLADALRARGVEVASIRWDDASTTIGADATVVIRSTWDYVDRPDRFITWLDQLDAAAVTVHNPTGVLRWNLHKGYLLDLAAADVPIVPTELVQRGSAAHLDEVLARTGWVDVVVKPAVGGTARLAAHSGRVGLRAASDHLSRLLADEDAIVQPVVATVAIEGEVSIVAIAGEPVAAVVKRAAGGEWRVQSDFGGTAAPIPLDDDLTSVAATALAAAPAATTYARIDVVRVDGDWAVLELELVEPELFFRLDDRIAGRLADTLVDAH